MPVSHEAALTLVTASCSPEGHAAARHRPRPGSLGGRVSLSVDAGGSHSRQRQRIRVRDDGGQGRNGVITAATAPGASRESSTAGAPLGQRILGDDVGHRRQRLQPPRRVRRFSLQVDCSLNSGCPGLPLQGYCQGQPFGRHRRSGLPAPRSRLQQPESSLSPSLTRSCLAQQKCPALSVGLLPRPPRNNREQSWTAGTTHRRASSPSAPCLDWTVEHATGVLLSSP